MKSSMLPSRSPPSPGAAARLAARLERFCGVGIGYRALGECVEPGVSARTHRRLGHDAGCATLGVPRRSIELTLQMWDDEGAAPLLLEAVDEAISALADTVPTAGSAGGIAWSAQLARECVAYAIRIRITPAT